MTKTLVLPLVDGERDRSLPTTVYLPEREGGPFPLIVFGHGTWGHPRKFTRLLGAWAEAGYVVAAPRFPHSNDETPMDANDTVNQPADVRFVIDRLLGADDLHVDSDRIGFGGFSLGGSTAVAVGLIDGFRDPRVRAVAALAGGLWLFGAPYEFRSVPFLLLYGAADDAVPPYDMSAAIYHHAQPPKVLVTLEDGRHDIAQDSAGPPQTTIDVTCAFWDLYLRGNHEARDRLLLVRAGTRVESEGV